jgi:hypothetical protein
MSNDTRCRTVWTGGCHQSRRSVAISPLRLCVAAPYTSLSTLVSLLADGKGFSRIPVGSGSITLNRFKHSHSSCHQLRAAQESVRRACRASGPKPNALHRNNIPTNAIVVFGSTNNALSKSLRRSRDRARNQDRKLIVHVRLDAHACPWRIYMVGHDGLKSSRII